MNCKFSLLQNFLSFSFSPLRSLKKYPGGIQYPGFVYYPRYRTENFKDPPYDPSKLFLVIRYKSLKGTTYKEKEVLKFLSLDGEEKYNGHINIVKNIPSVNALLWKVKHLIKIKPITWKGELPKDGDYSGTYLRKTGEFLISPKLNVTENQLKATENFLNDKKLTRSYVKSYLLKKWNNNPFSGDI